MQRPREVIQFLHEAARQSNEFGPRQSYVLYPSIPRTPRKNLYRSDVLQLVCATSFPRIQQPREVVQFRHGNPMISARDNPVFNIPAFQEACSRTCTTAVLENSYADCFWLIYGVTVTPTASCTSMVSRMFRAHLRCADCFLHISGVPTVSCTSAAPCPENFGRCCFSAKRMFFRERMFFSEKNLDRKLCGIGT